MGHLATAHQDVFQTIVRVCHQLQIRGRFAHDLLWWPHHRGLHFGQESTVFARRDAARGELRHLLRGEDVSEQRQHV